MLKKCFYYAVLGMTSILVMLFVAFIIADYLFPFNEPNIKPSAVVLDRNHEILRHFSNDQGIFRHWISLEEVNPKYIQALITYEDRYFFWHYGLNPLSTLRAFFQWLRHGKIISGSSTLTMQVARLIDPHNRTLAGKVKQIFRAIQLENHYTKKEILVLYLNLAPMGGNIEGIQTASWRYFSKKAHELNLSESALLVGLPQKPSIYRPDLHPDQAKMARDKVLDRLVYFNKATKEEVERIKKDPIGYAPQKTAFYAPLISEELHKNARDQNTITTTLDKKLQVNIEHFIKKTSKKWPPHISGAALIINNHNHEVYAYIGSPDLFDKNRFGYIDMVKAIRSPGSTLKPFAYGMALDYGIIHEASLLTDVQRNFGSYSPKNFDHQFRGAIPMFEALQLSLNIPVVQVLNHLTPYRFIKKIRDADITILIEDPNLSVILGGVGINLIEQVRLFSSLATEGKVYPLSIHPNQTLEAKGAIMSEEASWLITKILSDIRPASHYTSKRKIAWKTGTSYGYRDAWAIGVSPDWTVGVWIGRPDGVPNIGNLANQQAAPLLFDLFNFLPNDQTSFLRPYTVHQEIICWPSGRKKNVLTPESCEHEYSIYALSEKIPPTLYDSMGETMHNGWPRVLQNSPALQQAKIKTLDDKSIIFKNSLKLALEADGNGPFRWYINGILLPDNQLDIGALPLGKIRISVLDRYHKNDSIEVEIRDY